MYTCMTFPQEGIESHTYCARESLPTYFTLAISAANRVLKYTTECMTEILAHIDCDPAQEEVCHHTAFYHTYSQVHIRMRRQICYVAHL